MPGGEPSGPRSILIMIDPPIGRIGVCALARKDWNFQAQFMGAAEIGGQWVIDTTRGRFVAIGSVAANAPRLRTSGVIGAWYWFTVNRRNMLRHMTPI